MNAAVTEPLVGVINAGSSSVKFSFYEGERRILWVPNCRLCRARYCRSFCLGQETGSAIGDLLR
jgi:hypothetical protein